MGVADLPAKTGDADRGGGVETRTGGVPYRGGAWPNESDKAAARAEMPGPWVYE